MTESLFIIITIIILYIFVKVNNRNLILVEGHSGKSYLVGDTEYKYDVASLFSKIEENMYKLRDYMYKNIDNEEIIEQRKFIKDSIKLLKKNLRKNRTKFLENHNEENLTSYSVNKGEELVLCVRNKNEKKLQDLNTMMYVSIHEMAHMGCHEIGHTDLFHKIFKYYLQIAVKIGIYKKEEYFVTRPNYCGMVLTSNILNDNLV